MMNINITNFKRNILAILEQTIKYKEPIKINTKDGNAVLLSEEHYNVLIETLHLSSIHNMKSKIITVLITTISDCLQENEVEW